MINRRCVMMLFFDLPMQTKEHRRSYRRFLSELKRNGFCALQESVYVRLLRDYAQRPAVLDHLNHIAPEGKVSVLSFSLSRFQQMEPLRGPGFNMAFFSDDTLYI